MKNCQFDDKHFSTVSGVTSSKFDNVNGPS